MRGFTNIFKKDYVGLNLKDLLEHFNEDSIKISDFKEKGIIKNKQMIKILGDGEITKAINSVFKFYHILICKIYA